MGICWNNGEMNKLKSLKKMIITIIIYNNPHFSIFVFPIF